MKRWLLEIVGNDVFQYSSPVMADSFDGAVIQAKQVLESVQRTTIEQLEIVTLSRL